MLSTLLLALGATCPGLPNSTGEPALLTVAQQDDGNVLDFTAEQMQPTNAVMVIYGPLQMEPMPFGQGELCVHAIHLHRGPYGEVNAQGRFAAAMDRPFPGQTLYSQVLFRDRLGRAANLSNLVEIAP